MVWCWAHLDVGFEDGLWRDFPDAPALIKFLLPNVTWWFHRDWWKFGACDRHMKMKPLYAVPENKSA